MGRFRIFVVASVILAASTVLYGQTPWSTFLDSSRATDWTKAGFSIPAYLVNCATQPTLTANSSGAAGTNATAIQNALASCDLTHNVVNIPAGTYYVGAITYPSHGNQVLRGAGPTLTKLISTAEAACEGYQGGICMIDASPVYSGSTEVQYNTGTNTCRWTGGTAQGSTSLTLSSCPTAPPLNRLIILDQIVDQSDNGGIYICNETTPVSCNYDGTGGSFGRPTRNQTQTAYTTGVTSLGGGSYTVTISTPIYFTNIQAGRNPGAWWAGGTTTLNGLENLSIDGTADSTNTVNMYDCYQCWAKNVTFLNGARSSIVAMQSSNVVIRDSYFYGSQSGSPVSYNIESQITSGGLVENNIIQQTTLPWMVNSATGWVFDYNFAVNEKSFAPPTYLGAAFASHSGGNQFNLYEGNNVGGYQADDAWGSTAQQTFFRNMLTGWKSGASGSTTPFIFRSYARAMNMVANVLGQPGYHTQYQRVATGNTTTSGGSSETLSIYSLGQGFIDSCGTGAAQTSPSCDALTASTSMRWGNWDVVSGVTVWNTTEASPGAVTFINANFTSSYFSGLSHTLPASFIYSSAPPFWPSSKPFPVLGTDVNGGNISLCSGGSMSGAQVTSSAQCPGGTLTTAWGAHVNSLPAQDCANSLGMPADGSGSAIPFDVNAAGCNVSQVPTPTFSPAAGTYSTAQTVSIFDTLGTASTQITTNEGSNANASNGDTPSRNAYTNCATSCIGGVWQPVNSGIVSNGSLACTTAAQSSGVKNGCAARSVVGGTITGTGTHALDNGKGAGGTGSATSITVSYGGSTANPCAAQFSGLSAGWLGLNFPVPVSNSAAFYSASTGASGFNTSFLGPNKNTMTQALSDAIDHYLTVSCMDINNTTASGVHAEFDTNHTISTDDYFGFGKHFNFSTSKMYDCLQGCSSWKEMDLKEPDGTVHTTFSWPANHEIFIATVDHRDPGCTSSSSSACEWYDAACFQDVTAGTPQICGNWIDPLTGTTPGGIPVHKAGFTVNEVNTQTQIDINAASVTISQNVWRTFVGYNLNGVKVFYTNDGSTPTTSSTPYVLPLSVATSQTLKALGTQPGSANSTVGSASYVMSATPPRTPSVSVILLQ